MIDFLFVYEHVNREIENETLIMHKLKKMGYTCELISFYGPDYVKWRILKKKAKVVIVPWLRFDEDLIHFLVLANKPYKIVNIQCEQVSSEMSAPGMAIFSSECKKAYQFCWGKDRLNTLIKDGVKANKTHIVGAVQLDYGKPLFADYYYKRNKVANEFNLNTNKKWLLFISSFSYSGYSEEAVNASCQTYGEQFRTFYDINIKSQKSILDWLTRLCKARDDIEIIYRPHPSEAKTGDLNQVESEIDNFHIIDMYSVKQWAKVCDYTTLWFSTSNAELYSLGVDYKVLRPYEIPKNYDVNTFSDIEFISSYEDFYDSIYSENKNIMNKNNISEFRNRAFEDFYSYSDDVYAYRTIANSLVKVLKSRGKNKFCVQKKALKEDRIAFIKDIVKSLIYLFDKKFEKFNIIDRLPFCADTKYLLKTRSVNYKNKSLTQKRMEKYLTAHDIEV